MSVYIAVNVVFRCARGGSSWSYRDSVWRSWKAWGTGMRFQEGKGRKNEEKGAYEEEKEMKDKKKRMMMMITVTAMTTMMLNITSKRSVYI